jgi:hypothetical protein
MPTGPRHLGVCEREVEAGRNYSRVLLRVQERVPTPDGCDVNHLFYPWTRANTGSGCRRGDTNPKYTRPLAGMAHRRLREIMHSTTPGTTPATTPGTTPVGETDVFGRSEVEESGV